MVELSEIFSCPRCKGGIVREDSVFVCHGCDLEFPIKEGIPIFIPSTLSDFKKEEGDFHSKIAEDADDVQKLDSLRVKYLHDDFLSSVYSLPKESLILDIGCGSGIDSVPVMKKGHQVIGIDISFGMIKSAVEKVKTMEGFLNPIFAVGDAEELPFEDNEFDAIYTSASLHHLQNPVAGLKEMQRCVKPGGTVVIGSEPNSWQYRFKSIKHSTIGKKFLRLFRDDYTLEKGPPGDWETEGFSRKNFEYMLKESDLDVVSIQPIWYICGFVQLFGLSLPRSIEKISISIDEVLRHVPIVKSFGWNWNVVAKKKLM